jgi:glycosyltransferase involved in cell wall biosynthesis
MQTVKPLVSLVIITYNASRFIIETLESAKSQTYSNLELIVSDDNSTDNTVDICTDWLECNKSFFANTQMVTTPINTGVSANFNRGIMVSSGEWIKPLAGDDLLVDCAIDEFLKFAISSNSEIFFSRLLLFGNDAALLRKTKIEYDLHFEKLSESHRDQLNRICKELCLPGPGMFFSRALYNKVNGFDERYPFCEEWPFFFNILDDGNHIHLLDKELVKYRLNEGSLCRTDNKMDKRVFDSVRSYFLEKRSKEMIKRLMLFEVAKQAVRYYLMGQSYRGKDASLIFKCYQLLRKSYW